MIKYLAVFLLILAGCQHAVESDLPDSMLMCDTDADCAVGGCSNQLCGNADAIEGIISTCEYREEYQCLELSACGCHAGRCGWEATDDFKACMERFR